MDFALKIPEAKIVAFSESVDKINKKLTRAGAAPISWKQGTFTDEIVPATNGNARIRTYEVKVFVPDLWMKDWKFIGRIKQADTVDKANIFINSGGEVIPETFRKAAGNCDHCRQKRYRKDTFVVRNRVDDRLMQVGSTCLGDFFGVENVRHALATFDVIESLTNGDLETVFGINQATMPVDTFRQATRIGMVAYLENVACEMRLNGWVSRQESYLSNAMRPATADVAWWKIFHDPLIPNSDDQTIVQEALIWVRAIPEEKRDSDYRRNLCALCAQDTLGWQDRGIVGSLIRAYKLDKEKTTQNSSKSKHIGTLGERITVEVKILKIVRTNYGWMYICQDKKGNSIVFFTDAARPEQNENVTVKIIGTVKKHGIYKSVPQTSLSRSRILEVFSNVSA